MDDMVGRTRRTRARSRATDLMLGGAAIVAAFVVAGLAVAARSDAADEGHASASATTVGAAPTQTRSASPSSPRTRTKAPGAAAPVGPAADAIQAAVTAAQAAGATDGDVSRDAVVVLDRDTGATYTAGDSDELYDTASLIKVAIVDELFWTGQMSGDTESSAQEMIELSDDDTAESLIGLVGGNDVLTDAAQQFGIDGAAEPTDPEYWGTAQITPDAMAQLLADSLADKTIGPWLLDAMSDAQCTAADGWPQCYGLRAVSDAAPIKQGWMCCLDGLTRLHSTGLLGPPGDEDRYVVVLFTEGDEDLYSDSGRDAVSAMAQQLALLTTAT
jgi:hypothetical protein